jgi:hypothetical protein
MVFLVTSFYVLEEKDELAVKRNQELEKCLRKNLNSPLVSEIHLFVDNERTLEKIHWMISEGVDGVENGNGNKITVIGVRKQPKYSDLFLYACQSLQGKVVMIANSDIYLSECDLRVLSGISDHVFALTRYEHDFSSPLIEVMKQERWGSHDAFLFQSPLKKLVLKDFIPKIGHYQNMWGSEDIVIQVLLEYGYQIYNPCYEIKIVHLHASGLREYVERETIAYTKNFIVPAVYAPLRCGVYMNVNPRICKYKI